MTPGRGPAGQHRAPGAGALRGHRPVRDRL